MSSPTLPIATLPPTEHNPRANSKTYRDRRQIVSLLQRCKNFKQILPIHAKIIRKGHERDQFIAFELLRLCFNFNSVDYASKIFQQNKNPNVYVYTAFIDGLVSSGSYVDGIKLYSQMIEESVRPDNYAIVSVLKACGCQLALKEGRQFHTLVFKYGFNSNRLVELKLIELYGKCGRLEDAKSVFDKMPKQDIVASTVMITCYFNHGLIGPATVMFNQIPNKDTVCWTAMIDGFIRNGETNKALEIFRRMQRENVSPNEYTIVCVLSACSQLGALELGRWIQSYARKHKIELNHFLGCALINMYLKCGCVDEALEVFYEMKERGIDTYNSIIMGFAINGKSIEAIEIFFRMIKEPGLRPNDITFVGALNACSHGGLMDLGYEIFNSMNRIYGIEPQIEHYGCMVDLMSRTGHLEEAYDFIVKMELPPDHIIWSSLLNGCKIHGNFEVGEKVAQTLLHFGDIDAGIYVLISNLYASVGKWEEAARVKAKMKESGVEKEPGCSLVEVNNEIHEFIVGDIRHPQRKAIYRKLEELERLLRSQGYSPATDVVLQDIDDHDKDWALAIHSERLAICYGLISTEPCSTIRVMKNLRVCNDCHMMIKLVAKITRRRIVVRDRNRFHHFENGTCSCGDYW